MSPAEQSFVQPERETCEVRLEVFVRESGEKECTEVDSGEEKGAWWTGVDRDGGRKKGRKEKGRKDGRKGKVWRRDHEISVNRKSGGGLRARRSRFNAR